MADQLFLSVWYPNFRIEALGPAILGVLRQFALIGAAEGDSAQVHAAAVYPIDWSEAPIYERIYEEDEAALAVPAVAVPEAMDLLHDDFCYEFETVWQLWQPETEGDPEAALDPLWREQPVTVRIAGFGPEFDDHAYLLNGQVRIAFGLDTPFLQEEVALDPMAASRVRDNVSRLLALVHAIEKNCGISSRRLWSESGESLAEKLVARLEQVN